MRWESQNGSFSVPAAKAWGTQKEFGYGEGPILDRNPERTNLVMYRSEEELAHYGIPGMKWGVRAKEYVKTGYNTIARRRAIQKMQRKAAVKAERQRQYEAGYKRGQQVASNTYFVKNRVGAVLSRKESSEKESLTDRAVQKGFDTLVKKAELEKTAREMGFDKKTIETAKTAASNLLKKLKDRKLDDLYDWIQTDDGKEKLQKAVNFVAKGTSKAIGVGIKAAPKISRASRAAAKVAKREAKQFVSSAAKTSYSWIKEGKQRMAARRVRNETNRLRDTVSKRLNQGANALERGAQYAHKGAHAAQRGLDSLLERRPRRRR